jgi:hypothetical protein
MGEGAGGEVKSVEDDLTPAFGHPLPRGEGNNRIQAPMENMLKETL